MIAQDHPYFYLSSLFAIEDAIFFLSKYVYKPDSLFDDRELLTVTSSNFTEEWVNNTISSLRPDQELALHSKMKIKTRTFHIPMIDFVAEDMITEAQIRRIKYFLPKRIINKLSIFQSGRSFHAYSTCLIPPKDWIQFMGKLLLINLPNESQIIDTRWVGHRLISDYSALRWSHNTDTYIGIPHQIKFLI